MLITAGYNVVLLGGKTDHDLSESFKQLHPRIIDFIGKTSVQETAAILDLAAVTVCNDSGPMHIAATTKTRVIAIFGPTDPMRLAPLDARHIVLRRQSLATYEDGKIHLNRIAKARIIKVTPHKVFSLTQRLLKAHTW
jgi:ADP-heptose:LPS heptosyltransferase